MIEMGIVSEAILASCDGRFSMAGSGSEISMLVVSIFGRHFSFSCNIGVGALMASVVLLGGDCTGFWVVVGVVVGICIPVKVVSGCCECSGCNVLKVRIRDSSVTEGFVIECLNALCVSPIIIRTDPDSSINLWVTRLPAFFLRRIDRVAPSAIMHVIGVGPNRDVSGA